MLFFLQKLPSSSANAFLTKLPIYSEEFDVLKKLSADNVFYGNSADDDF